jgi:hypothetical protein
MSKAIICSGYYKNYYYLKKADNAIIP